MTDDNLSLNDPQLPVVSLDSLPPTPPAWLSAVQRELATRAVATGVTKALEIAARPDTPDGIVDLFMTTRATAILAAKPYLDAIDQHVVDRPADPEDGTWMVSRNEEYWDNSERFRTKAEAEEYARTAFAEEYGLQDGDRLWVGQVDKISVDELACAAVDVDRIEETLGEFLYDNVGSDYADDISWTREQGAELQELLEAAIALWMRKHDIKPTRYRISCVSSLVFEQCHEVVESQRCERYAGHEEGKCETLAMQIASAPPIIPGLVDE